MDNNYDLEQDQQRKSSCNFSFNFRHPTRNRK